MGVLCGDVQKCQSFYPPGGEFTNQDLASETPSKQLGRHRSLKDLKGIMATLDGSPAGLKLEQSASDLLDALEERSSPVKHLSPTAEIDARLAPFARVHSTAHEDSPPPAWLQSAAASVGLHPSPRDPAPVSPPPSPPDSEDLPQPAPAKKKKKKSSKGAKARGEHSSEESAVGAPSKDDNDVVEDEPPQSGTVTPPDDKPFVATPTTSPRMHADAGPSLGDQTQEAEVREASDAAVREAVSGRRRSSHDAGTRGGSSGSIRLQTRKECLGEVPPALALEAAVAAVEGAAESREPERRLSAN